MEKTQENPVANAATEPANTAQTRKLSAGEKLFDFIIYGPVNFFGTLIATVPIAWSLQHGFGKKGFDRVAEGLTKLGASKEASRSILLSTTTMMGGNLMLIPVKLAENVKVPIVRMLNRWMGDTTDPAAIEEAPKQTWMSLLQGRIVAWTTVFVSMFAADKFFHKQFESYNEWFGQKAAQWTKRPTHINGAETKTYGYGKLLALDIFATVAATTILYFGSRFFARSAEEKKQRAETTDVTSAPLADAAPRAENQVSTRSASSQKPRQTVDAATIAHETQRGALPGLSA